MVPDQNKSGHNLQMEKTIIEPHFRNLILKRH